MPYSHRPLSNAHPLPSAQLIASRRRRGNNYLPAFIVIYYRQHYNHHHHHHQYHQYHIIDIIIIIIVIIVIIV